MKTKLLNAFALASLALAAPGEIKVESEHLVTASPAWSFQTITRPSQSDLAHRARVTLTGNQFARASFVLE